MNLALAGNKTGKREVLNRKFVQLVLTPESKIKKDFKALKTYSYRKLYLTETGRKGLNDKSNNFYLSYKTGNNETGTINNCLNIHSISDTPRALDKLPEELLIKSQEVIKSSLSKTPKSIYSSKSDKSIKSFSYKPVQDNPIPEYLQPSQLLSQTPIKGLKGYKYSTLNTNRNLVKSNMIRKIFY